MRIHLWAVVCGLAFLGCGAFGAQDEHKAPCPPVSATQDTPVEAARSVQSRAPTTLYSHGAPTNDEQYMLEMINRARANPTQEGTRLATTTDADVKAAYTSFGVNLVQVQADFAAITAQPPLAFNSMLIASARRHTTDMYNNNFQSHTGTDGSTITTRINEAGYTGWNAIAENIYAWGKSVWYGHCGFNVDWGNPPPYGHRQNIMSSGGTVVTEIGIGISYKANPGSGSGPYVITQDFGLKNGTAFLCGVVYNDANGNGFYDPAEGVSGVSVTPTTGTYYATSSSSGGYAIPITGLNGSFTVNFSGGGVANWSQTITLTGKNMKLDYVTGTGGGGGPTANAQTLSTPVSTPASITLTGSGGTIFAIATNPSHGTLSNFSATGTVTYTPDTGYTGADTFTFTVSDGTTTSAAATVTINVGSSGSTFISQTLTDTDGDGAPDELETWMGWSPTVADTFPKQTLSFGSPAKLAIKLNFAKAGADSVSLSWPQGFAAGFQIDGRQIVFDIGGFMGSYTLDAKGKAYGDNASIKVAGRIKEGVIASDRGAKVTIKLSRGTVASLFADEGLTGADAFKETRSIPAVIIFLGTTQHNIIKGTFPVLWSARAGRSGNAKGGL